MSDKDFKNIKVKKAKFYISSKEELPGYKKITYEDRTKEKDEEGNYPKRTTYHKEFTGFTGILKKIDIYEASYGGKEVRIFVEDDDNINVLELPIKTTYRAISDYVTSIARVIANLEYGKEYTLIVNTKRKNDKGIPFKGVLFLAKNEEDKQKVVRWSIEKEEIPAMVVTKDALGEKEYDSKERDSFYKKLLVNSIAQLDGSTPTEIDDPVQEEEQVITTSTDDYDDLPF